MTINCERKSLILWCLQEEILS